MDNLLVELLVTIFLGGFGVHKFLNRQIGWGLVYLFTGGLFGIGWFIDVIKVIIKILTGDTRSNQPNSNYQQNSNYNQQGQQRPQSQPQTDGQSQYVETSRKQANITCSYCGEVNEPENKQCYNCGASLSDKH